jgi:hypothetical protein
MPGNFYADLPLFTRFNEVTHPENYTEVPDGWWVLIGDVVGSTQAIETGKYKEVNVIGASTIMAVLNAAGDVELPYTFGGDGAALLIPREVLPAARQALCGTRRMARESFGLDLLVGAVPIEDLRRRGKNLRVAKFGASMNFAQSMFNGGGIAEAERMVKDPATRASYEIIEDAASGGADFSGLECRWQGIPARSGETISLLVQVHRDALARTQEILDGVIAEIDAIYGNGTEAQPVSAAQLQLCVDSHCADTETRVRAHGRSGFYKMLFAAFIRAQTWLGAQLMARGLRAGGVDWGTYKSDVVAHTDYRKFDDTLRMVLDSTATQRIRLEQGLEARRQRGELVYGIHVAREALMTCLIFERGASHAHFVDGANGGYALAAQKMKSQLVD